MTSENLAARQPTKQVDLLAKALLKRGLVPQIEYYDGHKHIDIALIEAKLFIEVDGLQHLLNPDSIISDFKRDHYSDGDDYSTFRIPNSVVDKSCEKLADAIAEVAKRRLLRK